jgi:CO dehydrogenase/acetyl-CoA synthase epsilon subunit
MNGYPTDELQALVKHEMEHYATFTVHILGELGLDPNWRDLKGYKSLDVHVMGFTG